MVGKRFQMGLESFGQPSRSSEVERNPKMSTSFFWLVRGCRWGSSPLTSLANHKKLNVIQKWAYHSLAGEWWWMEFESIDQPGWSPEIESNPIIGISFFWLKTGGGWGLNPLTSPADHQKLNVIQKWAFHFFCLDRGGAWGLSPLTSPTDHQKLNVIQKWAFHSLAGDRWQMGFESIDQPGQSSEVEHNPKMSTSFFWLERGGRWDSSSSTSPADHQKLNIIQKWAFHFFWLERGGGWGSSPLTSPAKHQKLNVIQKWAFHFLAGEG